MQSIQSKLLEFMKDVHQLYIPIFQRQYSWKIGQCDQLLNDILKIGSLKDSDKTHFIGSVVYIKKDSFVGSVSKIMIIDGQQRITTITLLISALSQYLKEHSISNDNLNYENLLYHYLENTYVPETNKYKLLLNDKDDRTLKKIIDNISSEDSLKFDSIDSENIKTNFNYFLNNFTEDNVEIILKGLKKLDIIQIALDQHIDNPQLIYESLNSTGLALSKADLIRNFILMSFPVEEQDEIYKKYWKEMEEGFNGTNLFDRFIRDYLTIKLNHIPSFDNLYEEFKDYSFTLGNIRDLIIDINKYAKYYFSIAFGRDEEEKIKEAFKNFNQLKARVTYPFFLQVYHDYSEHKINEEGLLKVLDIVESYIFRRSICDIPTNSLNKTFASIYNRIDHDNYIESLSAQLLLLDSYKRFPNDEEFRKNLITQDLYNYNNIFYFLNNLECYHHSKESLDSKNYSIEHIMPQNPNISDAWKASLGEKYQEVHDKYLHTLGNLTITAYNPELSDSSFEEKKTMDNGFEKDLIHLNKYLANLPDWNENEITKRADILASLAIKIWKYPQIDEETLNKYILSNEKTPEYTLDSYDYLYLQRPLFDDLESRILKLGRNVKINFAKHYIAYKTQNNFVYIHPQKNGLSIVLSMPVGILKDPENKVKTSSKPNQKGSVDHIFKIYSINDLDYAMGLIKQSYDYVENKSTKNTISLEYYNHLRSINEVFNSLDAKIKSLGEDVDLNITQSYIAFKNNINFIYIYPQKDGLQTEILMPKGMLKDPENKVNVKSKVHYNNRVSHLYKIYSLNDLDYAMGLIKQSYDYSKSKSSYQLGGVYTLDSYEYLNLRRPLYDALESEILNLDENVKINFAKEYISFKTQKNFVYIHPQKNGLSIVLSMPVGILKDPENKVKVLSKFDSKGPVDHVFKLSDIEDLDYVMGLIKQSFDYRESKYPKKIITLDSYKFLHYHTDLFNSLNKEIKSLGNDVNRELTNDFITYKNLTNFVDITPQKSALRITINMPFNEVDDPKNIGEDGTGKNLWEHGAFYFKINSQDDLDYTMSLIKQSYDYNS